MQCPYCNTTNRADRDTCYNCNKDISMLRLLVNKARYHYNAALEHAERGRNQEAATELNNALELDGSLTQARVVLGTVYARLEDTEKAKETWRGIFERDAQLDKAYEYLSKIESFSRHQPLRKWIRILGVSAVVLLVGLIGTAIYSMLPEPGLKDFSQAMVALESADYAAAENKLVTLAGDKNDLANSLATSIDAARAVTKRPASYQIDAIRTALAESRLQTASDILAQLKSGGNWPQQTEGEIAKVEDDLIAAYRANIEREANRAMELNDPIAIRIAQSRLRDLSDLAPDGDSLASYRELYASLDAAYKGLPQPGGGNPALEQAARSFVAALSSGDVKDAQARLVTLAENSASTSAAPEAVRRLGNLDAAQVQPVVVADDSDVLISWFEVNLEKLAEEDAPDSLLKLASLNARDVKAGRAPDSAEALYIEAMIQAAQQDREAALASAEQLRREYPQFRRTDTFDRLIAP